ncbi:hypothetical protein YPPY102_0969, partial [Yersinia pestis PY-102]
MLNVLFAFPLLPILQWTLMVLSVQLRQPVLFPLYILENK